MDILQLLSGQLENENILKQLSKSTGADSTQIQQALKLGVPALLQALGKNASTADGAAALSGALDKHKDDKIDNIEDFLNNADTEDGSKILNHIFAGKNNNIQRNLAKQTGLDSNQVSDIMSKVAPLVMGALGQQKSSKNVDSSNLASMLTGVLGSQGSKDNDILSSVSRLLDADDDGSVVDDVGKMLGGFFKK